VYVVESEDSPGISAKYPGVFLAYAGCDPHKINEVVDLMLENVARLQGSPADIQPDWFDRSKQLIINADALENETPDEQAQTAALNELTGLGFDFHAGFDDRINQTTLPQVQEEAHRYLGRCVVTISTPMPELVKQSAGRREYSTFPPVQLTSKGVQHSNDLGGGGGSAK
jgi:predicted Zn-dependent peptidase